MCELDDCDYDPDEEEPYDCYDDPTQDPEICCPDKDWGND